MTDLIKLDTVQTVQAVNAKTGATTSRVQRPSEYKKAYKVSNPKASNRNAKAAYELYYHQQTTVLGKSFDFQKAISLAQQGKLGIERVTCNADGNKSTVVFVDLTAQQTSEADKIKDALGNMNEEELSVLMEFIRSKIPATGLPAQEEQAEPKFVQDFENCPE